MMKAPTAFFALYPASLFQPQHVLHVVAAGFLAADPLCRAYGASGEHVTGMRPMSELDPFSHSDEIYRVFSHNIPAAYGLHADLFFRSLPGNPLAMVFGRLAVVAPEGSGYNFSHSHGSAGWRVLFHPVVRLYDLHVKVISQRFCDVSEDLEADIHPDAHVRRKDTGYLLNELVDLCELFLGKTGRSDDRGFAEFRADPEIREADLRKRKINKYVPCLERRNEIVRDQVERSPGREPCGAAGVLAYERVALPLDRP